MVTYIHITDFDLDVFAEFDGSQVVVSDAFVMFWKPPAPFSQWTYSPFEIDGVRYNCVEQYMMAAKARLFGDMAMEKQILRAESPRAQQKLGKRVAGFNEHRWAVERCRIVFDGNVAKFTQNPDFQQALLRTGTRILAEASPVDKVWGIGFVANAPQAYQPTKWVGLNLLGNVLSEVRLHLESA